MNPLDRFFSTKLGTVEESHVRPLAPQFHRRGFRNVGSSPPNSSKYVFFCYKSAPKGPILLHDFYNIWGGEGVPGLHHHAKFYRLAFKGL